MLDPATLSAVAEVISAIASALWPLSVLVVIHAFRDQLRKILKDIVEASIPGVLTVKRRLRRALSEAEQAADEARHQPLADRRPPKSAAELVIRPELKRLPPPIYYEQRGRDRIWAELAKHALRRGSFNDEPLPNLRGLVDHLAASKAIPESLHRAAAEYVALWSGTRRLGLPRAARRLLRQLQEEILEAIDALPYPTRTVEHVGFTLYSDKDCTHPHDGLYGIILLDRHPSRPDERHVVGTTRPHLYRVGDEVAWHWGDKGTGETWYRDPTSGAIREAWSEALEFRGRPLQSYLDEAHRGGIGSPAFQRPPVRDSQ